MISSAQIATRLVEATGAATAYFHRVLNDIIDTLNGVAGGAGVETVTPDGSGIAVILHGYSVTGHPISLGRSDARPTGATPFLVQVVSVDATELTVLLTDNTGAPITTGSWDVAWRVGG